MAEQSIDALNKSIALHSGDYVEKYNRKSLGRVKRLVGLMETGAGEYIADFACGNGMLLQALGKREGQYVGVDFSQDFVDSANIWAERSGLINYRFVCADIINFCSQHPGEFDIATTLDFSEHIDDALAVQIYTAVHSSLKPGGKLYIHTPNLDFFMERAKDRGLIAQFPEHIAVRNGPQMLDILMQSGFERSRLKLRHIAHYNVLKLLHPLSYLPLVGKYFEARLWIEAHA